MASVCQEIVLSRWCILYYHMSGPLYPKLSTCFEGAQLTQLVLLVTASRLFLGHEEQVDL